MTERAFLRRLNRLAMRAATILPKLPCVEENVPFKPSGFWRATINLRADCLGKDFDRACRLLRKQILSTIENAIEPLYLRTELPVTVPSAGVVERFKGGFVAVSVISWVDNHFGEATGLSSTPMIQIRADGQSK